MKKFTTIVLALLLFFVLNSHAQSSGNKIDSIKHLLATAKEDSSKAKLLRRLGNEYEIVKNEYETAKYYYKKAGDLSKQIHYNLGIYNYVFDYSSILVDQGIYDSALTLNNYVYDLANNNKDSAQSIRACYNMGVCNDALGNHDTAITYILRAKEYWGEKKQMKQIGKCANELTILYIDIKAYKKAIRYGKEAVRLHRMYDTPASVAIPLQNLSVAYCSMQQPKLAKPLLMEALAISKKYHRKYDELNTLINLVDVQFHLNEFDKVKPSIDRIFALSRSMNIDEGVCDGMLNLSRYYMFKNDLNEAKIYTDSALVVAKRLRNNNLIRESYFNSSHIAYANRHYMQALKYDEQVNLTQEAITDSSISHSIIEIQTKYETAKKDASIKELKAQKELQRLSLQKKKMYIYVMIGLIIALLIIAILYYRYYTRKQKLLLTEKRLQQQQIASLEKEKQLMATQAVLQGQEEERTRLAKDLHDGLGGILTSTKFSLNNMKENLIITSENAEAFERTMAMLDKSISELRRVAHNMMPESLINQTLRNALNDFCHQVSANGAISIDYQDFGMENLQLDNTVKVTVYRIVQELINNTMRHAQATTAIVQLIVKDSTLSLTVEDNGKGFDTSQLSKVEGIGYKNLHNRVAYLNGKVDIRSKENEGTSVYIQIPL